MLADGVFGIALHAGVDGSIDSQAVGIDIVGRTVLFEIFIAPAVERIAFPGNGIVVILLRLPLEILALDGFLGHHDAAEIFAEVSGQAFLVRNTLEMDAQRLLLQGVTLCRRDVAGVAHQAEHHVAPVAHALGLAYGIVERGILAHAHKHGRLGHAELLRRLVEIYLCRRLDANGVMEEVEVVKVKRQDFVFRIVALQFHRYHPFNRLLQQSLRRAAG